MKRAVRRATVVAAFLVPAVLSPSGASAVELMKDLPCALAQTTHKDKNFCLEIFNTCNTPIVSRIEEQNGVQQDSPEIRRGERDKVCSAAPFVFLGHYIVGP